MKAPLWQGVGHWSESIQDHIKNPFDSQRGFYVANFYLFLKDKPLDQELINHSLLVNC